MDRAKKLFKHLPPLAGLALIIFSFFRHWLQKGIITAGDWGFFWPETMRDFWPGWQLWDSGFNFGRVLDQFFVQFSLMGWLVEAWNKTYAASERFVWFFPLLLFLIIGPYFLVYTVTQKRTAAFFPSFKRARLSARPVAASSRDGFSGSAMPMESLFLIRLAVSSRGVIFLTFIRSPLRFSGQFLAVFFHIAEWA